MIRLFACALIFAGLPASAYEPATSGDERVVFVAEVEASLDDVWDAFTTNEGLRRWMAPLVEIDLEVGGTIKSNYNPSGEIGDAGTIVNTVLAYDPKHMLALKATGYPEGFPFAEAAKATWSVFYFEEVSATTTAITIVGLGYTDSEDSRKLRDFFEPANAELLRRLGVALAARAEPSQED
jgi:uncharacterized protein YndB with AHSA1/START domain